MKKRSMQSKAYYFLSPAIRRALPCELFRRRHAAVENTPAKPLELIEQTSISQQRTAKSVVAEKRAEGPHERPQDCMAVEIRHAEWISTKAPACLRRHLYLPK